MPRTRRHVVKILKKYFIPHRANKYHPHILHTKHAIWTSLAFLFLKIAVIVFALLIPLEAYVSPDVLARQGAQIIALTNQTRREQGLPALETRSTLSASAQMRADDMVEKKYFSHLSPDGHRLAYFLSRSGYHYSTAGENLAMGFSEANEVMTAWMKSPTHYANLIDPEYREFGVGLEGGIYDEKPTVFIAQHFGAPQEVIPKEPVRTPPKEINTPHSEPVIPKATSTAPQAIALAPVPKTQTTIIRVAATSVAPVVEVPKEKPPAVIPRPVATRPAVIVPPQPIVDVAQIEVPVPASSTMVTEVTTTTVQTASSTEVIAETIDPYDPARSFVAWKDAGDKTVLEATVVIPSSIRLANVVVDGYTFDLHETTSTVYAGTLTIPESSEQLFRTVISPTVRILRADGSSIEGQLTWIDPRIVTQTPWQKYLQAQSWFYQSIPVFVIVHWLYFFAILFFSIALIVSMVVEFRKQHPHVIVQTAALITLLFVFYKF
ncbi:hypothetical protein KBA73_03825 [Patescibacteria group bacterium]|nr:hypothetical protein [Patescibacteria group bacterium]